MPGALAAELAAAATGFWATAGDVAGLPAQAGAYALAIRLDRSLAVALPRSAGELPPGWHVYLGSARGPGGLRGRLARHFRTDKRAHWHVDRLTLEAGAMVALAAPAEDECALVDRLLARGRFRVALPAFGSSDCRHCPSHLLAWSG